MCAHPPATAPAQPAPAASRRAPYIASLLTEGLKLREEQLAVGSPTVSWTLGAALVEGYRLGGLAQAGTARGDGFGDAHAAAAAVLLWLRAMTPRTWALTATAAACVWYFSAWWRQRRGGGGGGWGQGSLDKRRSVEAAEVELHLLPLASPPRLAALRLHNGGGPSARTLSPPAGGSGVWASSLASPRSPLQALGAAARQLGAPRFSKRRSQSWAAFGSESGGGLTLRDMSYGSSLNRLGRTQTFARRAIGTLMEDA